MSGPVARTTPHGDILGFAPPLCLTAAGSIVDMAAAVDNVAGELG